MICQIFSSRVPEDKETLRVYNTLAAFLNRGQIVLELFPPLSFYVIRLGSGYFKLITLVIAWLLTTIILQAEFSLFIISGPASGIYIAIGGSASLIIVVPITLNALIVSRDMADSIIVLAFLAIGKIYILPGYLK